MGILIQIQPKELIIISTLEVISSESILNKRITIILPTIIGKAMTTIHKRETFLSVSIIATI